MLDILDMFVLMQLCLGFDQQMALCSHWTQFVCCERGTSLWTLRSWEEMVQHHNYFWQPGERHQGQPSSLFQCFCHLQATPPWKPWIIYAVLTLGPRSGLHSPADPSGTWRCRWDSRAKDWMLTNMYRKINTTAKVYRQIYAIELYLMGRNN